MNAPEAAEGSVAAAQAAMEGSAADDEMLSELAAVLFGPAPGIEILQTDDMPDFASEAGDGGSLGLLDQLLDGGNVTFEDAEALLLTAHENEASSIAPTVGRFSAPQSSTDPAPKLGPKRKAKPKTTLKAAAKASASRASEQSQASSAREKILVTDAATNTEWQTLCDLTCPVLIAPPSQWQLREEAFMRQWQQWQSMASRVLVPTMPPRHQMIAAQLPRQTQEEFMNVGPQLPIFARQIPLAPLQFPMLAPPGALVPPRRRRSAPTVRLPEGPKPAPSTKKKPKRLHHILWIDEEKFQDTRKSCRMLERASRKCTAGVCAFTVGGSLGSQAHKLVLGRKWAMIVIFMERQREGLEYWERSLTLLRKICRTIGVTYPTVVGLYTKENATASLSVARKLFSSCLIRDACVYPTNPEQLNKFLEFYLPGKRSGIPPWMVGMKKKPTGVQQAVTAFAARGTRIITHRPLRPEPVIFRGPMFNAARRSMIVCNRPGYLRTAIQSHSKQLFPPEALMPPPQPSAAQPPTAQPRAPEARSSKARSSKARSSKARRPLPPVPRWPREVPIRPKRPVEPNNEADATTSQPKKRKAGKGRSQPERELVPTTASVSTATSSTSIAQQESVMISQDEAFAEWLSTTELDLDSLLDFETNDHVLDHAGV